MKADLTVQGAIARLKGRHMGAAGMMDPDILGRMAAAGACGSGARQVPGFGVVDPSCVKPKCPSQHFSINAINLGAGAAITVAVTPNVTMYVDKLIATATGVFGFLLSDLFVNNEPQWVRNSAFHTDSFAQLGGENTDLNGDGIIPGSTVEITITNLDAVNAQSCFLRFMGPATSG